MQKLVPLITNYSNGGLGFSDKILVSALSLALGTFFYSAGIFGFLNIFGLRRTVQLVLIFCILPMLPFVLSRYRQWIREPLWWMILIMVFAEVFIRSGTTFYFLFDRISSLYVVALIFSMNRDLSEKTLRIIILLSALFSSMVFVQAILVWYNPEALSSFILGYTSGSQAEKIDLGHPYEYLGLTSPGTFDLFGHPFARFRSFTSEPSALVSIFFIPGVLALGYKGLLKMAAAPILFFAVFLSGSGTVLLSLLMGFAAVIGLHIFRNKIKFLYVVPFLLSVWWYTVFIRADVIQTMMSVGEVTDKVQSVYGAADHFNSGVARLYWMKTYSANFSDYLFGLNKDPGAAVGILLHMFLYGGIAGLIVVVLMSYKMFRLIVQAYLANRKMQALSCALLYGAFSQVNFFSEFGWMCLPGFMLMAFMMHRMERLTHPSPIRKV